ncbi:MAG: alpha/beta hydrolase [Thaumarchaeota archaeon]|nr:alpha/beta hydrolase [Nitrososphaerota archaeon]
MPITNANGVDLYYELTGDHGDPIVLIHGSWTDHSNWSPVVAGLSESFRVVSYDRRGHGRSGKTGTQGSGEEDALDAAALLTRLDMVPAHVVGNSFGGSIALKLAAAQPQVFRSLMVHEPPLFDLITGDPSVLPALAEGRKRREQVIRVLESGDRAGAARLFVETLTFGPGGWERMSAQSRERMIANADTWLDETRDSAGSSVDLEALARFRKPALLTYGGRGMQGSKRVIEKLAQTIPGSKVDFDPGTGHAPHVSDPGEFVRKVTAFAQSSA